MQMLARRMRVARTAKALKQPENKIHLRIKENESLNQQLWTTTLVKNISSVK